MKGSQKCTIKLTIEKEITHIVIISGGVRMYERGETGCNYA